MAQDTIKCYDGPSDVVQALAEDFIAFTNEEISRTESCIVGITGGTVVNGLLELLNSPEYIERLNWERIFFVWTDERFLPQTHEDNYFNRVKPHLLCKAKGGDSFLPINTDSRTVVEAAEEYQKEIKECAQGLQEIWPRFSIARSRRRWAYSRAVCRLSCTSRSRSRGSGRRGWQGMGTYFYDLFFPC